jgi:hypothetical protein
VFSYFREALWVRLYSYVLRLSKTQTTFVSLAEELEESGKMKCVYRNANNNFSFCETNSLYENLSAAVSVFFSVNEL